MRLNTIKHTLIELGFSRGLGLIISLSLFVFSFVQKHYNFSGFLFVFGRRRQFCLLHAHALLWDLIFFFLLYNIILRSTTTYCCVSPCPFLKKHTIATGTRKSASYVWHVDDYFFLLFGKERAYGRVT
ncbi:hypothetical protein EDC01DRAFT_463791 [Geopyxis carbonaria]|nr:hypothetical protein EDC01DRAFT_463791 [Geopyxis carbonaria]